MITQERLKEVLNYNPETGVFMWMVAPNRRIPINSEAGVLDKEKGYIAIRIDGVKYLAHRLAILYTDGYWPENTVDHGNRVRSDNRRINLTEAPTNAR